MTAQLIRTDVRRACAALAHEHGVSINWDHPEELEFIAENLIFPALGEPAALAMFRHAAFKRRVREIRSRV